MTVNILEETPKEQRLNAIQIYELCITSNIEAAYGCNGSEPEEIAALNTALSNVKNFADEMRRLVEGAM